VNNFSGSVQVRGVGMGGSFVQAVLPVAQVNHKVTQGQ
jgi:hypothetical protein